MNYGNILTSKKFSLKSSERVNKNHLQCITIN